MKKIICLIAALSLIGLSSFTHSASDKSVLQLLKSSGVHAYLEEVPAQAAIELKAMQDDAKIPKEVKAKVITGARTNMKVYKVEEVLLKHLAPRLDQGLVDFLIDHFEVPHVKRVRGQEQSAGEAQNVQDKQGYLDAVSKSPPSKQRQSKLSELDKNAHATKLLKLIRMAVITDVNTRLKRQMEIKKLDYGTLDKKLQEARLAQMERAEKDVKDFMLYVYRKISPADLDKYLRTYRDEDYQAYMKQLLTSLEMTFEELTAARS